MPASALAVAMPEPMRPPPNTAIFFMRRGFRPPSVIPRTFLVARCAKKMCTRALCVSSEAAFAKAMPSCRNHMHTAHHLYASPLALSRGIQLCHDNSANAFTMKGTPSGTFNVTMTRCW